MLTQPEFPSHRRRDPVRLAELQVYTEFMNSDRAGRVLYEVKTSRNVPRAGLRRPDRGRSHLRRPGQGWPACHPPRPVAARHR